MVLLTLGISKSFSQHAADTFAIVPLCNLDLNRVATKLSAANLATVSPAVVGYKWNSGDASTVKWRPQGITGVNVGCKSFPWFLGMVGITIILFLVMGRMQIIGIGVQGSLL